MQDLIDAGTIWHLEGAAGRAALDAINAGEAILGPRPVRDYWGNLVPAWWMVEPGTPGSPEHAGVDRPPEPSRNAKFAMLDRVGLKAVDIA